MGSAIHGHTSVYSFLLSRGADEWQTAAPGNQVLLALFIKMGKKTLQVLKPVWYKKYNLTRTA